MKGRGFKKIACGVLSGFLNGLFGSGGGVIAVMLLRGLCEDERRAHATATLMMLIMSAVSLALYGFAGQVDWGEGLRLVPGGVAGALVGSLWLKSIGLDSLKRLFGGVIALSGALMLFR